MDPYYAAAEPGTAPAPSSSVTAPAPRARIGVIVLTTILAELAIIGALGNQWMTDRLQRRADNAGVNARSFELSWLTYAWRASSGPLATSTWGAQLLLVLTVVVVSALLVWALVRGPVTFARAFFGTWAAVIAATLLGAFVRGLVDHRSDGRLPGANRVTRAVFGGLGPNESAVVASFALGFVVALIVAAVAVTTRRKPEAPTAEGPPVFPEYSAPRPSEPPAYLPPWQDSHYGPPPPRPSEEEQRTTRIPYLAGDEPGGAGPGDGEATTQLPRLPEEQPVEQRAPDGEGEHTQAMAPPEGESERTQAMSTTAGTPSDEPATDGEARPARDADERPESESETTTRFPRPPDDDDLGHLEH
jgi:hypothetical protein